MKGIIKLLIIISISLISLEFEAQNIIDSGIFKISFETTEVLEKYETGIETFLGYDNDNYAVDIEIVSINQVSKNFRKDLKYAANEIARDMEFEIVIDGGKIPFIDKAYYVITTELDEGEKVPVYILAAINEKNNLAYEITVYCYDKNSSEGERIIKSFKFKK